MENNIVDISKYENKLSIRNKLGRLLWNITSFFLFKPFSLNLFNSWRIFLLRCFGAELHSTAHVYSTVDIWAPWNLKMKPYSCLGPKVDCYNTAMITIGAHTTISQKTYLCAASHDITSPSLPLVTSPIIIEDQVWVAADSFIGMGVKIEQGAVVGARASVFKNVESWTVVGGNPAQFIKKREIKEKMQ